MIVVLLTHPERDMHSVLYAFPSRVIFYGSSKNSMISATCCRVQKWENYTEQNANKLH